MNAAILSNMAGLLVREVWGAFEHRQKQRIRQARPLLPRPLPHPNLARPPAARRPPP